ncbi:MAG TPA: hypothetical protein DCP69_04505 [Candidatus Omnitrophica bacterium]|nr:hypothetical protein [Candidatus Omnitrophota bacterium]
MTAKRLEMYRRHAQVGGSLSKANALQLIDAYEEQQARLTEAEGLPPWWRDPQIAIVCYNEIRPAKGAISTWEV